jgi:CRISPR-associated endonuclease/helicase Cas3
MFFVALHDLGKLDIRFQSKAPFALKQLQPDIVRYLQEPYQHGASSYACFVDEMSLYGIDYYAEDAACDWMHQVAGHHGVIPCSANYEAPAVFGQTFISERDRQVRIDWIRDLNQLFQVDLNAVPETVPTMLAGFCSVCDWIGSSGYFTYETNPEITLADYLNSRAIQANEALTAFGILTQLKPNETLETLFPLFTPDGQPYKPRGLQTLTEQLPLVQNLTFIEAPTGSGKTETALVYAAKLLHQGLADR